MPDNVIQVDYVPHEWLFERVSAVVYHGGAGTTAASLRVKAPNIIVPFGGDQPFWGNCVYKQGLGSKPIMIKRLTVDNLSAVILETVQNTQIIENSRKIGTLLHDENGVEMRYL